MTSPSVFISYSHKDEEWKDRLVTHLGVLEQEGILDLWDDRRIEAGDHWKPEIEDAINKATVAILMISANFLTSKFILSEEVPKLLERREKEGVRVIPVIVKPCAWVQVKWLSKIQARPKDGKSLSGGNEHQIDTDLAALANEIASIVKRASVAADGHTHLSTIPSSPEKVSLAKLPSTSSDLFGRDKELKELDDAWNNPHTNVVTLVAWGGVGKSALVNKWLNQLARDNYRGAERVYGWSFYSQGAVEGRQVSADQFIASALAWFGDHDLNLGSPWDKGERLAELIKQQRTLLILDGLEPLQNPPPVETGRIKDPGLTSLLRELARQNPGLVIISTRLTVDDLKDFIGGTTVERDIEALSDIAGAKYLKHLGVDGTEDERKEASRDFGGHALALTLMGSYLKVVHGGDIRKRKEIPHVMDEQQQGKHARRVMQSYEVFLKDKPELDILRLMGLFDRPAEKGALDTLRKEPAIAGLTNAIQKVKDVDWQYAINNLRDLRLIAATDSHKPDALDCHPLLRDYFGEQLRQSDLIAWRAGNNRLYEYYKATAKEFPDTIQEIAPLFAAIIHGCQAGKHQEAYNNIYLKRIRRGNEDYAVKKLGIISEELAIIHAFFELPWQKVNRDISRKSRTWLLNTAGFDMRALGRLTEAIQPMQTNLKALTVQKDWIDAAITASSLSELYLSIGNIAQALIYAEQSIVYANRSSDWEVKAIGCTVLGNTQYQAGQIMEAQRAFQNAEEMQKKYQPQQPFLYSMQGYEYCSLLLRQESYAEVIKRVTTIFEWRKELMSKSTLNSQLNIALDNLSLGSAHLLQSQREPNHPFAESLIYLNRAVESFRRSNEQIWIAQGLLSRADYYCITGVFDKAQKDLDEAFSIATRSGMGLHLADCHLEYARLALAQKGDHEGRPYKDEAHEHLNIAKEMIAKMGYHRRDKEVEELEDQLK